MPDLSPFGGTGTQQDAAILRRKLDEFFALAPAGSVVADPVRREAFFAATGHVIELTAQLAAVNATIPGRAGRIFATAVSGVEKDPGTGKVQVGQGTAGNFAPSPIGFLDPTAIGLPRNFYLPRGATDFLPREADRIGIGLPEQRAADEQGRVDQANAAARASQVRAQTAVAGETVETLTRIAAGQGGANRAGVVIATSDVPLPFLQNAATAELTQRARLTNQAARVFPLGDASVPNPSASVAELVDSFAANLELLQAQARALDVRQAGLLLEIAAQGADPLAGPVTVVGADLDHTIAPRDGALRNRDAARGINRELASERADP